MANQSFLDFLFPISEKYQSLQKKLSEGDIDYSSKEYQEIQKEYNRLEKIVNLKNLYEKYFRQIKETQELLKEEKDDEILLMSQEELASLQENLEKTEKAIKLSLIPPDPNDDKNIIIEIRAGTGGDEACIFAGDLFRMYSMFSERQGFKVDVLDSNEQSGAGGYKEIVFSVSGKDLFSLLKYERGVHRVQRVPDTETQGRVHTSTVTVAVLPEAEETDFTLNPDELKIEVCRAQGAGGQHVNKTESAVKIYHIPTGIVVQCQDGRSQHKNKEKALKVLKAKLKEKEEKERKDEVDSNRRSQIGSGERAEKIRTYNYPQNRLTDHRINLTLYNLDIVMEGNIEEIIEKLSLADKEEVLEDYLKSFKM
ncbi:MAG TPA: peptide chain release factor 1 [Spirochaetia bacterium]|nr:peptide chain release factor 1 [Spirochaetia bacterium]